MKMKNVILLKKKVTDDVYIYTVIVVENIKFRHIKYKL